jgi:CBS domain containing-hemolysin-like protein
VLALTIAEKLAGYLAQFPSISEYAEGISFAVVVIAHLGRIPAVADSIETNKLRFEVMDMDGKRVDRVLITRLPETDPDS